MCDGGRRFLSENIDNSVLNLFFGINDSEKIETPDLPEDEPNDAE